MNKATMDKKVNELRVLRTLRDSLNRQIEGIESDLKAEMLKKSVYEYEGSDWKISWNLCETTKLDTEALKFDHPVLFQDYQKTSSYRRFLLR